MATSRAFGSAFERIHRRAGAAPAAADQAHPQRVAAAGMGPASARLPASAAAVDAARNSRREGWWFG